MIEDGPITCSKYSGRIPTYTIYTCVYYNIQHRFCSIISLQTDTCVMVRLLFQISTCRSFLWTSALPKTNSRNLQSWQSFLPGMNASSPGGTTLWGGGLLLHNVKPFLWQEIMKLTPFFGWFEMPRNSRNFKKFLESIRGKCQFAPRFFWRPKGHPSVDSHGADVGGLEMEDVGEIGTS